MFNRILSKNMKLYWIHRAGLVLTLILLITTPMWAYNPLAYSTRPIDSALQGGNLASNDLITQADTKLPFDESAGNDTGSAWSVRNERNSLTFTPDIADGLTVTMNAGTTATGTITINNPTTTDVVYSFVQYNRERDGEIPAPHLIRGQGGPDAFGYTWIDSNEPGGPAFEAIDISETGTQVTLQQNSTTNSTQDDGYADVELPFNFPFYGQNPSSVRIWANGLLSFNPGYTGTTNVVQNLPDPTPPNGLIAPMWMNLHGYTQGRILTETLSDHRFVIQYTDWSILNQQDQPNTFQVILSPTGAIKYQYLDINGTFDSTLRVATENHNGTTALLVSNSAGYLEDGLAVLISTAPLFISTVTPAVGVIPAGGSVDVTVTFDTTWLIEGTYTGRLAIATDEPHTYNYPVSVSVIGEAGCVIAPNPIGFGDVIVGLNATLEASVTNQGTASCELTDAFSSHAAYTVDLDPVILAPGASATFSVTFAPTELEAANGILTVSSPEGDILVALNGFGVPPPIAAVDPAYLNFNVQPDQIVSQTLTLSNLAASNAADLAYTIAITKSFPDGQFVIPEPVNSVIVEMPNGMPSFGNHEAEAYINLESGGITYARANNNITITHSASLDIPQAPTPAGCALWVVGGYAYQNSYWRVFNLSDFDITDTFTLTSVDVGVWMNHGFNLPIMTRVRLYTLDGAMHPSNMTLVTETDLEIRVTHHRNLATAEFLQAPTFSPEDVLVVEWAIPTGNGGPYDGHFVLGGQNAAGETGPSYVHSMACSTPSPVTLASIGFPDAHWVMQVHGTSGPLMVRIDTAEGSVSPQDSAELTVTANTEDMLPGLYEFVVLISTNDPSNPVLTVPVIVEVSVSTDEGVTPLTFDLLPNYPNPFTGVTTIAFQLPQTEHVLIEVIDLTGRRVAVLIDEQLNAARHEIVWNANGLASGVYLYRMQAGSFTRTHRTTLVR